MCGSLWSQIDSKNIHRVLATFFSRGLMRLSRGAKVLWEKFESGEEADTEIQQQRNHTVIIFQEASYWQGAVNIGEKQESGRGDAG
jgi:hypothetical protein